MKLFNTTSGGIRTYIVYIGSKVDTIGILWANSWRTELGTHGYQNLYPYTTLALKGLL